MGLLAWAMMGIAIWHFTVFLPDRFLGGIVGAFLASLVGSILFGLALHGFTIPGKTDTHVIQAFIAIPGSLIGLSIDYFMGVRNERLVEEEQ